MSLKVKSMLRYLIKTEICWRTFFLGLAVCLWAPSMQGADLTFPTLAVGVTTYSNVTVTSRAPRYIVVSHSQGMASIKLKDLSPELLKELGYKVRPDEPQPQPAPRPQTR